MAKLETASAASISHRPKSKIKKGLKQWWEVLPFLLIGLIGVTVFVIYPIIKSVYMSLYHYNIINPALSEFLGLDNYMKAFKDPTVYISLRNTLLYTLVTVPGQWVIGIFLAIFININFIKFKVVFRTIYYIPVITSWIVVSYLFKYLFTSGPYGFVNYIFYTQLHIFPHPINWLQNEWTAMTVIWILGIWKGTGWVMVIYLAALQSIPKHFYEAAMIDGAGAWHTFKKITLPLLKPTTLFIIINLIIGSFNVFIQVYTITGGAPLGRTEVLLSYMYKQAFQFMDFGYATALSVLMGILIFILTYSWQRKLGQDTVEF